MYLSRAQTALGVTRASPQNSPQRHHPPQRSSRHAMLPPQNHAGPITTHDSVCWVKSSSSNCSHNTQYSTRTSNNIPMSAAPLPLALALALAYMLSAMTRACRMQYSQSFTISSTASRSLTQSTRPRDALWPPPAPRPAEPQAYMQKVALLELARLAYPREASQPQRHSGTTAHKRDWNHPHNRKLYLRHQCNIADQGGQWSSEPPSQRTAALRRASCTMTTARPMHGRSSRGPEMQQGSAVPRGRTAPPRSRFSTHCALCTGTRCPRWRPPLQTSQSRGCRPLQCTTASPSSPSPAAGRAAPQDPLLQGQCRRLDSKAWCLSSP